VRITSVASIALTVGSLTIVSASLTPVRAWSIGRIGFQVAPSIWHPDSTVLRKQSACTGARLARAAHSWAVATRGPAGTSKITGFYCRGSYALANASTTEGGGYGFELTFRMASASTWKVVASANLVPRTGLPRNVYTAFVAIQPKLSWSGAFHF
jgi:hypothetical protein